MPRPKVLSDQIADVICRRLAAGESLSAICKGEQVSLLATMRRSATEDAHGFAEKYDHACYLHYRHLAGEIRGLVGHDGSSKGSARKKASGRERADREFAAPSNTQFAGMTSLLRSQMPQEQRGKVSVARVQGPTLAELVMDSYKMPPGEPSSELG